MAIEKKTVADEQLDEVSGGLLPNRPPQVRKKIAAAEEALTPLTADAAVKLETVREKLDTPSALFSPNGVFDDTDIADITDLPNLGLFKK